MKVGYFFKSYLLIRVTNGFRQLYGPQFNVSPKGLATNNPWKHAHVINDLLRLKTIELIHEDRNNKGLELLNVWTIYNLFTVLNVLFCSWI